ncbi:MAG TPA: FkbM family methyltransferase [Tepidisphaeraceae bacterium]|jgi:FkbM family methyltransferase
MRSSALLPNRFCCQEGIDLVNFGDYRGFMLVEDNLYKITVPEDRKHFPIEKHYAICRQEGFSRSPVNRENIAQFTDSKWGIYIILDHLIRHGINPTFLDVGSFVGDVGMRYGNYFRTIHHAGQVYCFDPSLAGELIPYNIRLNGLEDFVTWIPRAVSDVEGFITFFQRQGHSDSASASMGGSQANTIVESLCLSHFIADHAIQSAFIKLDTENLEQRIMADVAGFLKSSVNAIGFEFHAHLTGMHPVINQLLSTHVLFDIGYLPKPFCFRPITPETIAPFVQSISRRKYGYTDILAISRNTPKLGELSARLGQLTERPVEYWLVYE